MLSRKAIISKANALIKALNSSEATRKSIILKDVNDLILEYPQSIEIIRQKISLLASISKHEDEHIARKARCILSLVGHADPPKSAGLRILSIDGGGTRGLVSMEVLRHFEAITNKRIHELFDIICGVSSGSIISMAVGSGRYTIDQCDRFYREMSEKIFKDEWIWTSTPRLLWTHAYYDASQFENILKKYFSDLHLMTLASYKNIPKLVAVAVNAHTVQPYLFRTYNLNPNIRSKFDGTCVAEVWQACRASSAAPGFFQEFKFGSHVLLDGGMLVNNCTGIAHAEACCLWPRESVQCVISIGSGKFKPKDVMNATATSLYEKAHSLVYSATDTETIHMTLQHLLPNYFRFNPQLSENMIISEKRKLKLDQLRQEANQYMIDNQVMLERACSFLTKDRPFYKKILDISSMI